MSPDDSPGRKLGPLHATLLVMGGIVGVGIFFTPQSVAADVSSPLAFVALWVAGGLVAMVGAFVFAELGARLPRSGGWFVYLHEACGPFPAFLFAWVVLFVVSTAAIAVIASVCAYNLAQLVPGGLGDASQTALACAVVVALTLLSLRGVKTGAAFQSACMLVKLLAIAALVAAGLALAGGGDEPAALPPIKGDGGGSAAVAALLPVLFSYGGWHFLCYTAGEVRDARRVLPRAIVVGVAAVCVLYVALNLAYLRALGLEGVAASSGVATDLARHALGANAERFVAAAVALSALGVCTVLVLTTPWLYVAMAREGLFFERFARLAPRTGAPTAGLLLQGAIALVYLLVVGSRRADFLTGTVVFAEWMFHGLAALALLRLRRRAPGGPTIGPRWSADLYLLVALLVVVGSLWQAQPHQTRVGLIVLAVGAVVYPLWRRLFATAPP